MADRLASIYGTEKDKVNCSFYFKIGACRHGEKCSRKHVKPNFSQTLLLPNLYQNPGNLMGCKMTANELQEDFDLFFEDIFMELAKYGEIEEMNCCDNVGDHLVGNVYVRFAYEEDAGKAVDDVNNRFYAGRPLYTELSPVTDFGEACCRQYEQSECTRGGFCNFMHLKPVSKQLKRELYEGQRLSIKMLKPRGEVEEERTRKVYSRANYNGGRDDFNDAPDDRDRDGSRRDDRRDDRRDGRGGRDDRRGGWDRDDYRRGGGGGGGRDRYDDRRGDRDRGSSRGYESRRGDYNSR